MKYFFDTIREISKSFNFSAPPPSISIDAYKPQGTKKMCSLIFIKRKCRYSKLLVETDKLCKNKNWNRTRIVKITVRTVVSRRSRRWMFFRTIYQHSFLFYNQPAKIWYDIIRTCVAVPRRIVDTGLVVAYMSHKFTESLGATAWKWPIRNNQKRDICEIRPPRQIRQLDFFVQSSVVKFTTFTKTHIYTYDRNHYQPHVSASSSPINV